MSMFANADSHAPPPPGVMETYACMFNPGKDMDDLMAARDYYVKQAEKAGIKLGDEFVWTPIKVFRRSPQQPTQPPPLTRWQTQRPDSMRWSPARRKSVQRASSTNRIPCPRGMRQS